MQVSKSPILDKVSLIHGETGPGPEPLPHPQGVSLAESPSPALPQKILKAGGLRCGKSQAMMEMVRAAVNQGQTVCIVSESQGKISKKIVRQEDLYV